MTYQPASRKHDVILALPARDHEHLARSAGVSWWLRIKEMGLVDDSIRIL
jgi:hypothetical protein